MKSIHRSALRLCLCALAIQWLTGCATALVASKVSGQGGSARELEGSGVRLDGFVLTDSASDSGRSLRVLVKNARRQCGDSTGIVLVLPPNPNPKTAAYLEEPKAGDSVTPSTRRVLVYMDSGSAALDRQLAQLDPWSGYTDRIVLVPSNGGFTALWRSGDGVGSIHYVVLGSKLDWKCRSRGNAIGLKVLLLPAVAVDLVTFPLQWIGIGAAEVFGAVFSAAQ